MITIFLKVLVIFLMVAAGFIAGRTNALPQSAVKPLVDLLLYITCPCMILSSMAKVTMSETLFHQSIQVLTGSVFYFIVMGLFAWGLIKLMHYQPAEDAGVFMVLVTAVNTGFMGFPVTRSIFGDYFLILMVLENVVLNLYLYIMAPVQMNYGHKAKDADRKHPLLAMINMCTIACVAGLVILFLQIPMPEVLLDFSTTVGDATVPVSMIVVGVQLAGSSLTRVLSDWRLLLGSALNLLLVPVLTFLAVNWLPLYDEVKVILIFAACFPCAVITVGVAQREGRNTSFLAEGVALTTALSMATLPLAAWFLTAYYGL